VYGCAGFRQERRQPDEDINVPNEDHNDPDPCELYNTVLL
jgi:hypothetical protein